MKKMIKIFALAFVMLSFAAATYAQVSATSAAEATIVTPITISNTIDMNFGNLYVSGTVAGTVILTPAGARSTTGGVGLPVVPGTVAAAQFSVTGTNGAAFAITLPAGATTISNGAASMTVDTWTSNPTPTGTLTGGSVFVTVGATLHVAAAQATGVYNVTNAGGSGEFTVTVNYN